MFERFRKPKVQETIPDVIPKHIMPNHKHIVTLGYDSKQYIEAFLEDLSRTQLMDFQDNKQFDGTKAENAAWEATSNEEWKRTYPIGEYGYKERIPEIVLDALREYKLSDLVKQVNGLQKKVDKLMTLISNAEFKLSGKDAMKL